MTSPLFWSIWIGFVLLRAGELWLDRRNVAWLLARGGKLLRDDGYGLLVFVHAAWLLGLAVEAVLAPWPPFGLWSVLGFALLAVGTGLRYASMLQLGRRWTARVVVLPTAPLVTGGPYRFMRHPIYVGVTLELVGLPLAFGLWGTLAVVLPLNAIALARRIRRENAALGRLPPTKAND